MDLNKFMTTTGRTTLRMSQIDDGFALYMRGGIYYMDMIVQHKIIMGTDLSCANQQQIWAWDYWITGAITRIQLNFQSYGWFP